MTTDAAALANSQRFRGRGAGGQGRGQVGGDRVAGPDDIDLAVDRQRRRVERLAVGRRRQQAVFGKRDEHVAAVPPRKLHCRAVT